MAFLSHTLAIKDRFSESLGRASREVAVLQAAEASLTKQNIILAASFGAIAIAAGVVGAAMAASFAAVEQRLRELEVVTTTTNQNIQQALQQSLDRAQSFSSGFIFSMEEIIGASFELASAGLNVEQTIEGVEQAAFLAAAGLGDLRETAILLGSELNTLGQATELKFLSPLEKARKIADSTALAVKKFQITLPILAEGLKFTVGPASQLGIGVDELNATLGVLNTQGLRASIAGTVLSNIFAKMSTATQKLSLDTSKFVDEAGNITSIADFLEEVRNALPTSPFERFSKLIDVFGIRAARGVVSLLDQVDALRAHTDELRRGAGSAEKFGKVVASSLTNQVKIAGNNISNFATAVGAKMAPALKSVFGVLARVAKLFSDLPSPILRLIAAFTVAVTILAAFKAAVLVASIALTALTGTQVAATASAVGLAIANAAVQASFGNVGAIIAVVTTLAIGTAAAYAFLGDETANMASNVDFANTEMEGISATITRTASDATLLATAIRDIPDSLEAIGGKEVNAFASLFDRRNLKGVQEELSGALAQELDAAAFTKPISDVLDVIDPFDFGKEIVGDLQSSISDVQEFADSLDAVTNPIVSLLALPAAPIAGLARGFQLVAGTLGLIEPEAQKVERSMEELRKPVKEGTVEFLEWRAALAALTEADVVARQLQAVANQIARVSGTDPSATFASLKADLDSVGASVENANLLLSIYQRNFAEAFKRTGISVPTAQIENFTANVNLANRALTDIANNRVDFDQLGPQNVGAIENTFAFLQNNLAQLEKTRFGAVVADEFRDILREAGKLDQIGSLTFAEFEQFTTDKQQEEIARLILKVDGELRKALRGAAEEANFLKGEILKSAVIDRDLVGPADRLGKRLEVVTKRASQLGESFSVKTLAEQSTILREQLGLYDDALSKTDAVVASLREQVKSGNLVAADRAKANKELDKAVKRQSELLDKTKAARDAAGTAERELLLRARVFLPEGDKVVAELQKRVDGVGGVKFSFELAEEARAKIAAQISEIDERIRQLQVKRSKIEVEVFTRRDGGDLGKEFQEGQKAAAALNKEIDQLNEERAQLRVDSAEIKPGLIKDAIDNVARRDLAGIGIKLSPTVSLEKEGIKLTADVRSAVAAGLKTGNFSDVTNAIGSTIKSRLIKGASDGLTEGLLKGITRGAAIEDLAKQFGKALATGKTGDANVLLVAITDQIKKVGTALQDAKLQDNFQKAVVAMQGLEQKTASLTGGMVTMEDAAKKATAPLIKDLARLDTLLQTSGAGTREFIEQIIALKQGTGVVGGLNVATLQTEERLQAALALLRQIKGANIGGAPVSELRKIITGLNEDLRKGVDRTKALGTATADAARQVTPVTTPPPIRAAAAAGDAAQAFTVPPETRASFEAIEGSATRIEAALTRASAIRFDPDPTNIQQFVEVLETIDPAGLERVIELLDRDVSLPSQIEGASETFDELIDKATEFVNILANATIGVDGSIDVNDSATGGLRVEIAGTTFTINPGEGGISETQRDEILRLAEEAQQNALEELRTQLENIAVLVEPGA